MKWIGLGLFGLLLILAVAWALAKDGGPSEHTVKLSVVDQKLYGVGSAGVVRVSEGDKVTLHITADEWMDIFLHGYDLEAVVEPGRTGTMEFVAHIPGFHALMIHTLDGNTGSHRRVEILLGIVDVKPRSPDFPRR